ncbi:MAG: DMT family transporter [Ignavibacteriae bacterium]|nr:DMT family transporter [Ignavibacteriota bacterium]
MSSRSALRGYFLVFLATVFWGGSASLAKFLFTTKYDPLIIVQMRISFSFLLYVLYFSVRDRAVFRLQARDVLSLVFLGVFGMAATNFAYYYTVKEASIATAIVIQYTAPVLIMVYAVFISKEETFNGAKVVALLLALAGCFLTASGGSFTNIQLRGWSLVSGIASAVCFAYFVIGSKHILRRYSVWTMLLYTFGFGSLFWLVVNPPWEIAARGYGASDWGVFLLFAVTSVLIPHTLFMLSLNMLDASRASIASTMEPVVAIFIAFVSLGEVLTPVQILGAVGVLAAVLLLQLPMGKQERSLAEQQVRDGE